MMTDILARKFFLFFYFAKKFGDNTLAISTMDLRWSVFMRERHRERKRERERESQTDRG